MVATFKTIGLLRFSVLTPTYYSERFKTLEQTAAHLFAPERMELRFRLFEALCLPSLARQSDPDFTALVLTAQALPEPWLSRLETLLAPLPNIELRKVGSDKHYPLLRAAYQSVDLGDATHRIMFRLDDDDAVDRDFIARTKRLAAGLVALRDQNAPLIIACNRGFYVDTTQSETEVFDACERAPLATGTTLVAPVDYPNNPYRYVHRKLPQYYDCYSDISVPAFIRSIHGDNKSNPTQMGLTRKMKPRQIAKALKAHFHLTFDDLKAL